MRNPTLKSGQVADYSKSPCCKASQTKNLCKKTQWIATFDRLKRRIYSVGENSKVGWL